MILAPRAGTVLANSNFHATMQMRMILITDANRSHYGQISPYEMLSHNVKMSTFVLLRCALRLSAKSSEKF